jgi:hypothetical protein
MSYLRRARRRRFPFSWCTTAGNGVRGACEEHARSNGTGSHAEPLREGWAPDCRWNGRPIAGRSSPTRPAGAAAGARPVPPLGSPSGATTRSADAGAATRASSPYILVPLLLGGRLLPLAIDPPGPWAGDRATRGRVQRRRGRHGGTRRLAQRPEVPTPVPKAVRASRGRRGSARKGVPLPWSGSPGRRIGARGFRHRPFSALRVPLHGSPAGPALPLVARSPAQGLPLMSVRIFLHPLLRRSRRPRRPRPRGPVGAAPVHSRSWSWGS